MPEALFINCCDTNPLSADPCEIINLDKEYFDEGISLLKTLFDCDIHITYQNNKFDRSLKGINYSPMGITLDSQGRTNSWLTVILKGGKNREIRETFGSFGLRVNRLIRVAYGPLNLGSLGKDEIVELDSDILQKQILKEWSLSRIA